MDFTLLLHKPVLYGSSAAALAFNALLVLHALLGGVAVGSAIAACATKKGSPRHIFYGSWFVRAMYSVAVTGIVADGIRLSLYVQANHTAYPGLGMPSTYPARFGFLYVSICILYILRWGTDPRKTEPAPTGDSILATGLLAIGALISGGVFWQYNPWTGALWMVWTFMLIVGVIGQLRKDEPSYAARRAQHRFNMLALAGFSFWGALQGFGPALAILLRGVPLSTETYTGNLPGPFRPQFFFFLLGWGPCFALAAYLYRRFGRAKLSIAKTT